MKDWRETLDGIDKSENKQIYVINPDIIKTRKTCAFRYFQGLGQITLSKLPGLFHTWYNKVLILNFEVRLAIQF